MSGLLHRGHLEAWVLFSGITRGGCAPTSGYNFFLFHTDDQDKVAGKIALIDRS